MSLDGTTPLLARSNKTALRLAICLVVIGLGVMLALCFRLPAHLVVQTGESGAYPVGPITSSAAFVQELNITGPVRIASLEVLLATWAKPANTTHDEIRIFDGSGRQIQALKLPPGTVADNAYVRVDLPDPLEIDANGRLFVSLSSSDGSAADSITAWATDVTAAGRLYSLPSADLGQGSLVAMIDAARPLEGAICIRMLGQDSQSLLAEKALRVGGLLIFLALAACVWWARTLQRWRLRIVDRLRGTGPQRHSPAQQGDPSVLSAARNESRQRGVTDVAASWRSRIRVERVYLVVALVWGLLLVFVTPPLQNYDELAHYYRAWSVAEGQLVVPSSGHIRLPAGADDLTNRFPTGPIAFRIQKVDLVTMWAELGSKLGSQSVESSSYAAPYGPTGYLPQAAGITVIRLFGGSPLLALYLGRLFNLVAAVLLTYFGLRFLPFAKLAICLVALLPMTMVEMASLSPDALLLGGCVFFSGLVLACTSKDSLSRRDISLLVISAVVLLNAKPGYAILSLLLLLLLPRQFTSRLAYFATVVGSIIASCLLALIFMKLAPNPSDFLVQWLGPDHHVNGMAQLRHVISHPLAFARTLGATINSTGVYWLRQSVAAYAWGQLNIGDVVMLIAAVGVAAVLAAGEAMAFAPWRRALVLAVALLTAVGVSLGLYMGWTAVAAPAIAGLQGRYFAPCVILGFIGLAGFPFRKRWLVPVVVAVIIVLLIVTNLRTLLIYYY